jgi:endonuclease-3 related protein
LKIAPSSLSRIYEILIDNHGPQGWWPIIDQKSLKSVYHLNAPRSDSDRFEITIGAILTQNIAWKNVEKALANLKRASLLRPTGILEISDDKLAQLIRSTGYYNQKVKKIRSFMEWFASYSNSFKRIALLGPALRDDLLNVKGIGPETADSIMLYALGIKTFVVDAYTRRILSRLGIISGNECYSSIQRLFHEEFSGDIREYNDYHALIVTHAKEFCAKKPLCNNCCLSESCRSRGLF